MKRLVLIVTSLLLFAVPVGAQNSPPPPNPFLMFIRDQAWQFGGFLIGAIALLASIIIYMKSRYRKELSYSIGVYMPVLGINEGLKSRVRVTFDGRLVNSVYLLQATLRNTGKVPVVPSDFLDPITLRFGEGAQVLSAGIYELEPPNLSVALHLNESENGVVFSSFLLNPGELMRFQVLVDSPVHPAHFVQRIIGITDILYKPVLRPMFPEIQGRDWLSLLLPICFVIFMLGAEEWVDYWLYYSVATMLAGLIIMVLVLVIMIRFLVLLWRSIRPSKQQTFD
jgi:hypothetical protein